MPHAKIFLLGTMESVKNKTKDMLESEISEAVIYRRPDTVETQQKSQAKN